MATPEQPSPQVAISPWLADPEVGVFSAMAIDAQACGALMAAWGVERSSEIDNTTIVVSRDTPRLEYDSPDAPARMSEEIYSRSLGRRVELYMGNVAHVLAEPPVTPGEFDWEEKQLHLRLRQDEARDASALLVEGLSARADDIILGDAALAEERRRAEKSIMIRKAVPRALGALATSTAAAGVAYANHKTSFMPEVTVDIVAAVTTAASAWVAWGLTKVAVQKQKFWNTHNRLWPADLRARARRHDYIHARKSSEFPELVTYELSQRLE